jgi:glycolate oxidase FAD binding subunit
MTEGLPPGADGLDRIETPESPAQVAELLAIAAQDGKPVRVVGGGGARSLGNQLRPVAWSLATDRLNHILEYQPTDMTLSVQAGARLADVSAALANHGQMLPIEVPNPDVATIGGLLATGLTGPRRYGGGTLRDVLIGISVAYPDGTVGKAGGMVVKNVSGFDMMRLHYGAMGTLGVIVSANFKVLPLPRAEFTLTARYEDLVSAAEAASALRKSDVRPVAAVVRQVDDAWQIAARYEGRDSGLSAVRNRLAALALRTAENVEGAGSAEYWAALMAGRGLHRPEEIRVRVSVAPSLALSAAQSIQETLPAELGISRFEIEPGLGTITLSIETAAADAARAFVQRLRSGGSGSLVTLVAAPDSVKAGLDVWGQEPETIEIMRALKREFDPVGILNPGCFVGLI